jgi:hypothetical protein
MRLLVDDDMLDDDEDAKAGITRRVFFGACGVRSAMNGDVLRATRARSMSRGEARSEATERRFDYQTFVD